MSIDDLNRNSFTSHLKGGNLERAQEIYATHPDKETLAEMMYMHLVQGSNGYQKMDDWIKSVLTDDPRFQQLLA